MHNEAKQEITPNYTGEESLRAEERLRELLELAEVLDVEVITLENSKEDILEHVRSKSPERYELVVQKLEQEGLSLSDLSKEVLIDRLLGIDALFRFNGKTFAIDVTTGKSSVVTNKTRRFQELEDIYRALGIDNALILRLKQDITVDIVVDLFAQLEHLRDDEAVFSTVIRYPDPHASN